jgi:hypothetical protein
MKNLTNSDGISDLTPRTFTFGQLSKICNENYGALNQCINLTGFKPDDIFVLTPLLIHHLACGEPVTPHLRTLVSKYNDPAGLALQDVTFQQWEQGVETDNHSADDEDSDLPF